MEQVLDPEVEIPVDTTGFDEDAWVSWLEAEFSRGPTTAERVERVVVLRAEMAQLAAMEARELAALAASIDPEPDSGAGTDAGTHDLAYRSLVAELAMATRVSDRTMASRLNEAVTLASRFPATLDALESGAIDRGHAHVIVEAGLILDDDDARAKFEDAVLGKAVEMTPGRLRRVARLAAEQLTETPFEDRHALARERRTVVVTDIGDGMSQLIHTLPTALAEATWDRLTRQAKAIVLAGDSRTFDQIRSDLITELLLVGEPSGDPDGLHVAATGIQAEVAIVIPMLTLLGQGGGEGGGERGGERVGEGGGERVEPATILGKGPIDLETAAKLAGNTALWTRILTDPITEQVLATDDYRPPPRLRRYLRYRDGRCRFPTCNRSAWRSDIDHTHEWHDGGKTTHDNLAHLCRYHHVLKSAGEWHVTQPAPGTLDWVSPLGRKVRDTPNSQVRFR